MESLNCEWCETGTMVERRAYRMHWALVTLGYYLLVSGLFGVGTAVVAGLLLAITTNPGAAEVRRELTAAGVPEHIQTKVVERRSITDAELKPLTAAQRKAVRDGQGKTSAHTLVGWFLAVVVGGAAIAAGIYGLLSLLVSWLLLRRKSVLACDRCGAPGGSV